MCFRTNGMNCFETLEAVHTHIDYERYDMMNVLLCATQIGPHQAIYTV